jgi:hypothetical protein
MDFLHKVEAIVLLDSEGRRLFAKYYPIPRVDSAAAGGAGKAASKDSISDFTSGPWPTVDLQRKFEEGLQKKATQQKGPTWNGEDDVLLLDGHTVLYRMDPEVSYFVVGGAEENELVLLSMLNCLYESLQQVVKVSGAIDKRTLLENYEALLLIVDELVDDSVILENNSSNVVSEVSPFTEQVPGESARKALANINRYLKQNLA